MIITKDLEANIRCLILSDPERRNPVGHAVREELVQALTEAEADPHVAAVVLTGAGENFSAGGDIRDQATRSLAEHRSRMGVIVDLVSRMVRFSKPLVSAVEGWAAGGGFSLALACPAVVASKEARFVAGFGKIGLIPDMGLLATLPARVGPGAARRIITTNQVIGASQALETGIVDVLAEPGAAVSVAAELAATQAAGAPMPRQYVNDWFARDVDAALAYERSIQPILLNSADAGEGRAAFFEKRKAAFEGR